MKKRLLSLVVCLAMLLPTLVLFTSCSDEDTVDYGNIKPMTIVIAMITDEKTNEAGIEAAEKALNQITESNLKTHVELKLFTEDEYYTELEKALLARRDAVAAGDKTSSLGEVDDVVFDEEKNREVTAFPEPYENQIDIFFVDNKAKLESYRLWRPEGLSDAEFEADPLGTTESLVSVLDDYLAESAPLLSKYLASGLLNAGKVYVQNNGELCAIPSNAIYDSAEYMIVDKKLFDASNYNIEEVTDLVSLENFLIDLVESNPDVQPVYNIGNMGFISLTGKNSVIAQYVAENATPDSVGLEPKTILGSAAFRGILVSMNKYLPLSNAADPITGNDLSAAEPGTFAVGFVKADTEEIKAYEENYYVIESHKASITTEQACGNMFAVSAFTSDAARCMEVLNMIQTNSEMHNALAYGEENVTYTIDETSGLVVREKEGNEIYLMDVNQTGNLFLTLPNTDMTEKELAYAANDWALAKAATRHAYYGPYIGFELEVFEGEEIFDDPNTKDVNESNNPLNLPTAKEIDFLEEQYYWLMDALFDYEEAVDEVTGEPLYATYAAYLDALDTAVREKLLPEHEALMKENDTEEPAIDAQDADEPLTNETPATGEPVTGEPVTGDVEDDTPKEITYPNVVASQLVATAGMKNIYRQFLDWRKFHYIAAS